MTYIFFIIYARHSSSIMFLESVDVADVPTFAALGKSLGAKMEKLQPTFSACVSR